MINISENPTVPLPGMVNLALWSDFSTLVTEIEAAFAEIESLISSKNLDPADYIPVLNRGFSASAGTSGFVRNSLTQRLVVALKLLEQLRVEPANEA